MRDTDLDGFFFMSRAAIPHLKKAGGSIVNVASVFATGDSWRMAAYNGAKGAAVNLRRATAMHHGKDGVLFDVNSELNVQRQLVSISLRRHSDGRNIAR